MARKLIPGDLVCMSDLAGDSTFLSPKPSTLVSTATNKCGYLIANSVAIVLAVDGIAVTCVYVLCSTGGGWCPAAFLKRVA